MTEEQPKSLDTWKQEIENSKPMWVAFYAEMLGVRPTNIPRLYKSVNLYGFWPVFEAIVDSSTRELTGDPQNYVLKVASNKWREAKESQDEEAQYESAIEQSKASSVKANANLEKRIERARKKK